MANGDAAAAAFGWVPIVPTDDIRLGYDKVNQLADFLAAADYASFNVYANAAAAASAGFVAQSGFQLTGLNYSKLGKRVSLTAEVTKVTAALTAQPDGDVPNSNVFSIPSSITPVQTNGQVSAGGTGYMKGGYVTAAGFIAISAIAPGGAMPIGLAFNLSAMWHL